MAKSKAKNSSRDGAAGTDVKKDAISGSGSSVEQTAVATDSSSTDASAGQAQTNVDQRLPENSEQAGAETDNKNNDDPSPDATNAAPPPSANPPPELEAAPLFAVCRVRIADRSFAPGAQIDDEYADMLSARDFAALLVNGSIREG